jgi:hypothetical protein
LRWVALAIALFATLASAASAQFGSSFTEIYNSGVLTLGVGQSLQLTIVNNNNVADPALPNLPTSEESCTFVAQFLGANGNTLQKQQQTLTPGQSFSIVQSGQSTLQARVDVSPGTTSGFASGIASQCVVSTEILNGSSSDPVLFAPLFRSVSPQSPNDCQSKCFNDCAYLCRPIVGGVRRACGQCREKCEASCP